MSFNIQKEEGVSVKQGILEICNIENELSLYDVKINGMPIWRSVYRSFRDKYIEQRCNFPAMSNHPKLHILPQVGSTLKSILQIAKIWLFAPKKDYLFYGFPRLENIEGIYYDKFCDPLILQTKISDSYLYFERGRSGIHMKPRITTGQIWIDGIDNISILFSKALEQVYYRKHKQEFDELFNRANRRIRLSKKDKKFIIQRFLLHRIKAAIFSKIVQKCSIKAIFAPVMMNWTFLIKSAKDNNIPCYEIQHGITEGETPMYSGKYLPEYSPDMFLAFGETSVSDYFNVPREKIVNIGFAFKNYLISHSALNKSGYLIVSEPEITQKMVDLSCELSKTFVNTMFAIRFHPLEEPNENQLWQLKRANILVDDNKVNSNLSILKYDGVIGEMSSVLYESLSLDVKTAKIHLWGLNNEMDEKVERSKGFFIINTMSDFSTFITENIKCHTEYYSDFKLDVFYNKILKA